MFQFSLDFCVFLLSDKYLVSYIITYYGGIERYSVKSHKTYFGEWKNNLASRTECQHVMGKEEYCSEPHKTSKHYGECQARVMGNGRII
jgi:hypothetical protein